MDIDDKLERFILAMGKTEDTIANAWDAIDIIASDLRIGAVVLHFFVSLNQYTPAGESREQFIYKATEGYMEGQVVKHTFESGEKGIIHLQIYHDIGDKQWSQDEEKQIDIIMELLFVFLGRYRLIEKLKQSAITDFMTGIPNSTGFVQYCEELKEQKVMEKYTAFYFNLKGFGLVNRMFGNQEANQVLIRYVRKLQEFFDENEILARLGGDNFMALIHSDKVQNFIELLGATKVYGNLNESKIPITISAVSGIVPMKSNEIEESTIMELSSVAISLARNILKQPYVFLNDELNERVYREKLVSNQFQSAIEKEEFVVYYQPKVETREYRVIGAEALVRWANDGNILNPGDFVPILEKDRTICQLDFYVLERVCQDIRGWLDEGVMPVRTSVNFSRKNLLNPQFESDVLAMIRKYGIDSSYIEVEITETTDVAEQERLNEFLTAMRNAHVATAIDDFGTGYSSLNILRSFPVDILKIDKSFIDNGVLSQKDSIVLANIVRMAKELDVEIITEGVETWQQVDFLKSIDCYMVQGFLFDKPLPKEVFSDKMLQGQYDINELVEIEQHNLSTKPQ